MTEIAARTPQTAAGAPASSTPASPAAGLVTFALDALGDLRMPSGLYCHERPFGGTGQGESVRYSLMVLVGLLRAQASGLPVSVDLGNLFDCCLARRDSFSAGDVGLALWADARLGGGDTIGLIRDLAQRLPDQASLNALVGMEVAWLLTGLCHAGHRSSLAAEPFHRLSRHLRVDRRAPSGLYYHDASSRLRRYLPNFATEIYTLLALALTAGHLGDERARRDAVTLADHLLHTQLPDGAWPWLFDARSGAVVERYELYSVHQDAMAPMALLELSAVTGDTRYEEAARRGLAWSRGNNELGVDLLDEDARFAHRSIRRRQPWDRVALAVNTGATLATRHPLRVGSSSLELNAVTRPYHLGWILEAWAGPAAAGR